MKRKDSLRTGLWMIPLYFAATSGILTMAIVWKGGESTLWRSLWGRHAYHYFPAPSLKLETGVVARSRVVSSALLSALQQSMLSSSYPSSTDGLSSKTGP